MSHAATLAEANNAFALRLYQDLMKAEPKENVFFSPFSIETALAMTHLGARGNTAAQMKSSLKLDGFADEHVHQTISDFCGILKSEGKDYQLQVANRLFARQGHGFLDEFLTSTRKYYDAEAQNLDFANDPEGSKKAMNDWVEEQTAKKITDLVTEVDPMIAMVLVNAIYFKGEWEEQFDPQNTHSADFSVTEEEVIQVQMMFRDDSFNTGYSPDLEAMSVELPYKGGDLSMVCILPSRPNSLSELESKLTAENIKPLLECPDNMKMMVHLPKFKLEYKVDLEKRLSDLGMADAFKMGVADFSGMDGSLDIYLSKVNNIGVLYMVPKIRRN